MDRDSTKIRGPSEAVAPDAGRDRLTRDAWIAHGLRTLARHGAAALKTGMLAAGLNVSRGSFYWHFESIGDFNAQLLAAWQARATDDVIREIDSAIVGAARLTSLMTLAFHEDRSLDRAFRAWAATDTAAAAAVANTDARRIAYVAKLLRESGVEPSKTLPRAEFIYWAYIGQSAVMDPAHISITEADLADLSGLFTRPVPPDGE
jgi:AcrR family transcriptional regulator